MFRFNPRSSCNRSSRCCYRPVSMSTRPGPEGSGTVEIATRRCPRLRVVWDLRSPTNKTQAMEPSRQTWSSYGPPYPLGRWSEEKRSEHEYYMTLHVLDCCRMTFELSPLPTGTRYATIQTTCYLSSYCIYSTLLYYFEVVYQLCTTTSTVLLHTTI